MNKKFPYRFDSSKKIGIFAASSPILDMSFNDKYKYFLSKNLNIFEHPNTNLKTFHTAGTIEDRVQTLHDLFLDDSVSMLLAFWGGNNSNDLLNYLDFDLIEKHPKIIMGYSDTTAILQAITNKTGLVTFMGPAAISFFKPEPIEYTWNYFHKMFLEPVNELIVYDSENYADDEYYLNKDTDFRVVKKNEGRKIFQHGVADGEVLAANLETLLVLAGTSYFPILENKILFLEESEGESLPNIYRNFRQLIHILNNQKLKGLLIGRFCEKSQMEEKKILTLLKQFASGDCPIIYNLNFGHSDPIFTIPNGGSVYVDTYKNLIKFYNFFKGN